MKKRTFLYQEKLEEMVAEGKASLVDKCMTIFPSGSVYLITPAVKFLSCETDDEDPLSLIGKVASYDNLSNDGAEIYLSSAIYKDHSFRIEQGYICTLDADRDT